jgi:signal transduction histidine kinase
MDRSPFVAMLRRVLASGRAETLEDYSSALRLPIEMRAYPSSGGGLVAFFVDLTERRRADDAATFLAEASRVLASSADYPTTLTNLARAAVPRLGDWCAVDVLTDPDGAAWPPGIERVAVVHQEPAKVALATTLTTSFPQDWSREIGTPAVIRTRQPMFLPDVTDAMLAAGAQNEAHLAMLRELHFRSIIVVPLVARDRVLGAITLVMAESERRFTPSDLALAVDLGRRAGVALDNARLLRDAANANAAKTEFLRTVSHELRQPLNAIRGYLDLWQAGLRGELTAAMREDVDRLSRNQEHLGALIEDLLSFTQLDAGRLVVDRVPVEVAPVFAALEAMVRPQMLARGLDFTYERCDPDLAALGDRDRIIQVCLNLLTNATRATPAGGQVALRCTSDAHGVTITVTDTGVGIPGDKLEAIFDSFTQLGRALNAPKEGAGLGLAISRGLAEAMDGTLTVTSVVGKGSVFSLRLPRAEPRRSS